MEEGKDAPVEIFSKDYAPPAYLFEAVELVFKLGEEKTTVKSTIQVKPSTDLMKSGVVQPLKLDGLSLNLLSIKVNGRALGEADYVRTKNGLLIPAPPQSEFELETEVEVEPPAKNTALEGLYMSSGNFCTQCEAEGFQRITFWQDRPDVMAKFTTRIEAEKEKNPVLLSNGNLVDSGDVPGGHHFAVFEDPFKKPCYLFALVAGQLAHVEERFTTMSGRIVMLRMYVQEQNLSKTAFAMKSLVAAMKWDEEVYGLEYDLDLYNIVAVDDFNAGAMENKGLNIFNSKGVLASPETATDDDYTMIEDVVSHEYFHNWTGNRVTCRDWFQLSLKEGLTIFREQEFSADMNNRGVKRIQDVTSLRSSQFSEDAGPMAHPVRPASYIKMDNFYTATVYDKGSEVVRMYQTLLGKDGFRKGMDLYFKRHDGQAVTCDDFFAAMRDANKADLSSFPLWYSQAGTPTLMVSTSYDESKKAFTLSCKQEIPPTPESNNKLPMLIPLSVGLLGPDGHDITLTSVLDGDSLIELKPDTTTAVLSVSKAEQQFTFLGVSERPVPSLLRNFSAPVRLISDVTDEQQIFILGNDSDEFNRWEAGQTLARKMMLELIKKHQAGEKLSVVPAFIDALRRLVTDTSLDKAFVACAIRLPDEEELGDIMDVSDPDAVHEVSNFVIREIASALRKELLALVESNRIDEPYSPDHASKARRSLKNRALAYLLKLDEAEMTALGEREFKAATNMTDQFGALKALAANPGPARDAALTAFYEQWKDNPLVINKWLRLQAMSDVPGNVNNVRELLSHPAFNIQNPNKVYALIGGFCSSGVNFHAKDGSGYKFLSDVVLQLDKLNAVMASRMASSFTRWRRYDEARQALACEQLQRVVGTKGLSDNVYEIASKTLAPNSCKLDL